jgi:hypothetical protein
VALVDVGVRVGEEPAAAAVALAEVRRQLEAVLVQAAIISAYSDRTR